MANQGHILVIEDDSAISEFLHDILSDEGYTVRVVSDATCAQAALTAHLPDLLLCDLHLPGLSGRALIAHLQHTITAAVPIMVMTADVDAARQLDGLNVAFCLIKPFDLTELCACVAIHLRVPTERACAAGAA
jgi:DNA-binding response OmpR family regulator